MSLRDNLNQIDLTSLWQKTRLTALEAVFLGLAVLFLITVVFFFMTKVGPLNDQVSALKQRETQLLGQLKKLSDDEKRRNEQTNNAEKILSSLSQFESYLKPDERGMTQILNELDALGKTHRIEIGDATYRVEEAAPTVDANGNPLPQANTNNPTRGNIYPALGIETTVIGDYSNLRRFLLDLERSKQFLIIGSLSFQGEAVQGPNGGPPARNVSGSEVTPVSLKIEFDTYFRKPTSRVQ
jgi:hypothetical protein